jgi:MFS family permease
VAGLTVARLVSGVVLKKISSYSLMLFSLLLSLLGSLLLIYAKTYSVSLTALIIIGIGLAAGFPVLLGYIGELFPDLSGTAFSIVLVIGLTGNTIINYLFGLVSHNYGIWLLPWLLVASVIFRTIFLFLIKQKISTRIKI